MLIRLTGIRRVVLQFLGAIVIVLFLIAGNIVRAAEFELLYAVERNDSDAALVLLKQGADVDASHPDGATALHWACLLYTSPSPRDLSTSRMPSSA